MAANRDILGDFWRFDMELESWSQIKIQLPPCLDLVYGSPFCADGNNLYISSIKRKGNICKFYLDSDIEKIKCEELKSVNPFFYLIFHQFAFLEGSVYIVSTDAKLFKFSPEKKEWLVWNPASLGLQSPSSSEGDDSIYKYPLSSSFSPASFTHPPFLT